MDKNISLKESKEMNKKNYEFFVSNLNALYEKYPEKYIAIKDCLVIGAYGTFDDAISETLKTEEIGTFLVQLCTKEEEKTDDYFFSNNIAFCVV